MIYSIQPNMIPMRDIKQVSDGDRLFYELGRKLDQEGGYGDNWIKTGQFNEIEDVKHFLWNDRSLSQLDYLEHHNFMLIKKNTDMEKEFVPYELSLRIKQLGFKEPCFGEYKTHQGSEWILSINPSPIQYSKSTGACLAPTYSQLFKWFRDNYRLSHLIHDCLDDFEATITQWNINDEKIVHEFPQRTDIYYPNNRFDSHEEAELACVEKLIEIVESEKK